MGEHARRPLLELLAPEEPERIVEEACRVLETTGVLVENEEGARLLEGVGAEKRDLRHRIPETAVRAALATVPHRFTVFDRDGAPGLDLGGGRVHFDPGSAAVHLLDSDGTRRAAATRDLVRLVRLVDGLPHYAAQATALVPSDVPPEVADRHRLYLALRYGRKPVVTGTFRADGFAPMHALLAAVRGGAQALRERPLALFDCCPSPPLKWSDLTCRALVECARAGIPATLVSMPLAGATAPVTLHGSIVQHCAESLSGVVLHQAAGPGAPLVWGGAPAAFDMRHGTTPMGAAESMMLNLANAQVGRGLGLPTHGYLGLSEAKTPDYQAGLESGVGAVAGALGGIDLVSGPGLLDYLLTQSLEKLLLDHEACGMALRIVRGIEPHPAEAGPLIAEAVARGSLLGHPHTRAHWKEELSASSPLIDRDSWGDRQAKGSITALERAKEQLERLLGPREAIAKPLDEIRPDPAADAELRAVMEAEARLWGCGQLPDEG